MSANSKIEWTDHTFNPWMGCNKVSPGCDHCYAEHLMDKRMHKVVWGAGQARVRTSAGNWREPLRWNSHHAEFFAKHGRRQRVFCASLADVFDNAVDLLWRRDLFRLISDTPNLDWLLLTKRIGNVPTMLRHIGVEQLPANVWLGATIVNRDEMLRDAAKLMSVPSRVHFWSVEPMLGDLGEIPPDLMPSWIISGGESGHGARPMHPDWVRSLRDQCAAAGVPFFFKQHGEWMPAERENGNVVLRFRDANETGPKQPEWHEWPDGAISAKVGKKAAGRLLDGRTHDEFPRGAS